MGFLSEQPKIEKEEMVPEKSQIGILSLEYGSDLTVKSPEGEILFNPDNLVIDIHIINKLQKESDIGFVTRLKDSLHQLAQYISENRNSIFKDVTAVRGITYDAMAKIAEHLGFKADVVDGDSIGSLMFKITGEYRKTNRAQRGKRIKNFYAISMPIDDFLEQWAN